MEAAAIPAAHKVKGKDMNSRRNKVALMFLLATAPALALAQDHGSGGGGCGDVFGDLVHILRDGATGQPILQKRWVELPGDELGWAYCPIPVNAAGGEIGFADLSCDPADAEAVVEVDYFGRLSGGRTKERNSRMHFNEVISSIKDDAVGWVGQDETGRLQLGYDCGVDELLGEFSCAEYRVIDSPMENMALYTRLMKYGHFQTDPMEEDTWAHGDPAAGIQYHPALSAEDRAKFSEDVRHLLQGDEENPELADTCFYSPPGEECAKGESLTSKDFTRAAKFLAGAANKTGRMTVDLVQYMNRILKVTQDTAVSTSTVDTLPALIRVCEADPCVIRTAEEEAESLPVGEALTPPADELFVDYGAVKYKRTSYHNRKLTLLQHQGGVTWTEAQNLDLKLWLEFVDEVRAESEDVEGMEGFILAASDGLRAIEFVHNYAIPVDLWTIYAAQQQYAGER